MTIYPENVTPGENIMGSWGDKVRSTVVPRFSSMKAANDFMSSADSPLDPAGFMVVIGTGAPYVWDGAAFNQVGNDKASSGHNHDTAYAVKDHNHNTAYAAKSHTHGYASSSHTHAGLTNVLTPVRAADLGSNTTLAIKSNTTYGIDLRETIAPNVLSGAVGAFAQIAIAGPIASGYLEVKKKSASENDASALNFSEGDTTSNQILVQLDLYGRFDIITRSGYDQNALANRLVVDIYGLVR
jgi:hypothetical protein